MPVAEQPGVDIVHASEPVAHCLKKLVLAVAPTVFHAGFEVRLCGMGIAESHKFIPFPQYDVFHDVFNAIGWMEPLPWMCFHHGMLVEIDIEQMEIICYCRQHGTGAVTRNDVLYRGIFRKSIGIEEHGTRTDRCQEAIVVEINEMLGEARDSAHG